jgi:hypothetical protein
MSLALCGAALAGSTVDRFYLPQPDQKFEGKVNTRIGKLEFSNQYPSKKSLETLLDFAPIHIRIAPTRRKVFIRILQGSTSSDRHAAWPSGSDSTRS